MSAIHTIERARGIAKLLEARLDGADAEAMTAAEGISNCSRPPCGRSMKATCPRSITEANALIRMIPRR
jgi:hypothetical protein